MNNRTVKAFANTPSAVTDRSTTLPCWLRMNLCTAPSSSLIDAITCEALMWVSKLSLRKSTVRLTYFSESPSSVAICWPTSVPMAATKMRKPKNTPRRITAVAVPRRHPRAASRLTPGSTASDKKSDTSNSTDSAERLDHTDRVTIETM